MLTKKMKLRFFAKVKRFLRSKKLAGRAYSLNPSSHAVVEVSHQEQKNMERVRVQDDSNEDGGGNAATVSLRRAVKRLHFGDEAEKESAAKELGRLAKEDPKMKRLLGELGVVHALVDMAGDGDCRRRSAALGALLELSRDGIHKNKVQMLEAGILMKLPKDIQTLDQEIRHGSAELLLSLSLLKNAHLGHQESSEVIEFVLGVLDSDSKDETKESILGTLCNLSMVLENASRLASHGMLVDLLLRASSSKGPSEKALAVLGNLVVTAQGKKALENSPTVPESLIEILTWEEKPKCQELSTYVLMILAHQSSAQRAKMEKSGIVQVLLELALLGSSPLAQKRALKLLQWFKDERQTKVGPHSGPQAGGRGPLGSPVVNRGEAQEGRKMMRKLVKESLHRNMEVITRRANAAAGPSGVKALAISTSSKSLPY